MAVDSRTSGIYVSYRGNDVPGYARQVYDRLVEVFGQGQVRASAAPVQPGTTGYETQQAVASSEVLLAMIGPSWLTATGPTGWRGVDDPNDSVRVEIQTALHRGVLIIPVLVQGAPPPRPEELPAEIRDLARFSGIELADTRWSESLGGLISFVYGTVRDARAANPYAAAQLPGPPPALTPTFVPPTAAPPGNAFAPPAPAPAPAPVPPPTPMPVPSGGTGYGYGYGYGAGPGTGHPGGAPAPFPVPPTPRPRRQGNRQRWAMIAGIAAAVLAIVALVGVLLAGGGGEEPATASSQSSLPPPTQAPATTPPSTPPPTPTATVLPSPGSYPESVEQGYLTSCEDGNPLMGEYCRCSLDEIEKRYTLEEFVVLSERLGRKEPAAEREVVDVVVGCIDKLPGRGAVPS